MQTAAPSWVELHTDHGSISSVSIHLERSAVKGIEISDLLLIVDRALAVLTDVPGNGTSKVAL